MNVLFIGGTGIISSACVELAVARGIDLTLLNRGHGTRPLPASVAVLQGDIRDKDAVANVLKDKTFDVVVDFVAFTPEHIETDLALFRGRTKQYIFISSASAYQTPPRNWPTTESTPLRNPYWAYSRAKIACEERLMEAYREEGFPLTIVRPSHTYDARSLPFHEGYTFVDRMRAGKKVIVHGDGSSLWVLTHHRDFAKGFVGLLGNVHALGEAIHITSDEVLNWNQIVDIVADAAGVQAQIVYIPSERIAAYDVAWGAGLLGDKAHSMVFDNSKIKRLVPEYVATIPFSQGAAEIIAWYDSHPSAQKVDAALNQLLDTMIGDYEATGPRTRGAA
ncbi:MAG: SDR family oxidoreductase [Herpetosiphonaceae bacterium]|nr:SDR family oxidoreductase [Herpetosiphonaceae bacterium]